MRMAAQRLACKWHHELREVGDLQRGQASKGAAIPLGAHEYFPLAEAHVIWSQLVAREARFVPV